MMKTADGVALGRWVSRAEESQLQRFAAGLCADWAAIETPWSNGQVEGQVNRLKLIKRTMYGRAGFELLRTQVLAVA